MGSLAVAGSGTSRRMEGVRARILVVRPDHLGDVLVTLPALAALRHDLPTATVAYAVPPAVAAVCERSPHVDEVVPVAFPPLRLPWHSATEPAVLTAAEPLRGNYDLAVLPRPDDPSSGALCATAAIPVRAGFAMPRTVPFLTHALTPPDRIPVTTMTHAVLAAGLAALRLPTPPQPGSMRGCVVPTDDDEAEAAAALAGIAADPAPVVLHPGSSWPLKNWPPARWGQVAQVLYSTLGLRPVVTGAACDAGMIEAAVAASAGTAVALPAGRLSLGGLTALHTRARLVAGVDSGALHLAAAVGTPTVALYGPGDPVQYAPAGHTHQVVRAGLPCSPCGTLEHPPCGAAVNPPCVMAVSAPAITDAVLYLLSLDRQASSRASTSRG